MVKHIVKGPGHNLGRFGFVRQGDILNLTDVEASYVQRNPTDTVEVWDGKKKLDPLEKLTPAEEAERKRVLAANNNPGLNRINELHGKAKDELLAECAKLKDRKCPINFRLDMSHDELVQAIIAAESSEKA